MAILNLTVWTGLTNFTIDLIGDLQLESMTGYSRTEYRSGGQVISVEIYSENNRFLDLTFNLPEPLEPYTEELKRLVAGDLRRGRVRITIAITGSEKTPEVQLNTAFLTKYYRALCDLARELQIEEPVTLQNLLTYPEIFITDSADTDVAELLTQVKDLLRQAVAELIAMRRREGEFITRELQSHLQFILEKCSEIEKLSQQSRQEYFTKYQQSLAELCQNCQLDENRLIQEAGILAKKLDITEECTRLRSHIQQFTLLLQSEEPVGKQMNFLAQEMNREITTIGSKSESAAISHLVVNLKNELEKIREQIQNVI
ncbi:MAG TPA: YicC family protein [Candidatus Marinimicrobia bacterium]|nr:YicC family protein [Candidatus Neomarinimicrobiota bacterium]